MGATSSTTDNINGMHSMSPRSMAKKQALFLDGTAANADSVDLWEVTRNIWEHRNKPDIVEKICLGLAEMVAAKAVFDQVELYLPQLAHMILRLENEWPNTAMEQFALLVSQSSVHFALQFFWILYAALEENRPKSGGDFRTFMRCSHLLMSVEQCLVYGSPNAKRAQELLARGDISKTELQQLIFADRKYFALQSVSGSEGFFGTNSGPSRHPMITMQGWIAKKGGGTSTLGRRNWNHRWCKIDRRTLLVHAYAHDTNAYASIPLDGAQVAVKENKKHKYYFEVHNAYSGNIFKFSALSKEDMDAWVDAIRVASNGPPFPPPASPPRQNLQHNRLVDEGSQMANESPLSKRPPNLEEQIEEIDDTGNNSEDSSKRPAGQRNEVSSVTPHNRESLQNMRRSQSHPIINETSVNVSCSQLTRHPSETRGYSSSVSLSKESAAQSAQPVTGIEQASVRATEKFETLKTSADIPVDVLSAEECFRFQYFTEQRSFIKQITDVCEELRFKDVPQRPKLLKPLLERIHIPRKAYIPLCKSTDPYFAILKICTDEGFVFSTNERSPCLMYFEVEADKSGDDVSTVLNRELFSSQQRHDPSLDKCPDSVSFNNGHNTDTETSPSHDYYQSKLSITCHSAGQAQPSESQESKTQCRFQAITQKSAENESSHEASPGVAQVADNRSAVNSAYPQTQDIETQQQEVYENKAAIRRVFGELWNEKKERIRLSSPFGNRLGWDLIGLIAKSNDDLRQEVFAMQLINFFQSIFTTNNLALRLHPYKILSTGARTGLIELVKNAKSLDGLKKHKEYRSLRQLFEMLHGPVNSFSFRKAQSNFANSLAAYSIICYILAIKDRHNGNIMLDSDGHIIHIDYGFLLGRAPGGSFSFETAPFKLTPEMAAVLDGKDSQKFSEYRELCVQGFLAAKKSAPDLLRLVDIMAYKSSFPCFQSNSQYTIDSLRDRLLITVPEDEVSTVVNAMIDRAYNHSGTNQYDQYQQIANGIRR